MIYLDNAATSWPKAPGTAEAMAGTLSSPTGNPGRSSHSAGISADRILFDLREALADLFQVEDSSSIILTSGATESLNTILSGFLKPGHRILTSSMEHNSVMRPLHLLQEQRSLKVDRFGCHSESGYPDMKELSGFLAEKPDLLVVTAASNVSGVVFPLEEIASLAKKNGVPLCVDAAQGGGEIPLYPERWDIDFLCFAGHKGLLGPAGTGGFYIKDPERVAPLITGGTGSRSKEERQPDLVPDKFESGTPNIPGFAGLLHSLGFLIESKELQRNAEFRTKRFLENLSTLEGYRIIGRQGKEKRSFTRVISLLPEEGSLTELTAFLNSREIAVRSGLHCSPSAHKTLKTFKTGGTLRVSPGLFTSDEDLLKLTNALKEFIWQKKKN